MTETTPAIAEAQRQFDIIRDRLDAQSVEFDAIHDMGGEVSDAQRQYRDHLWTQWAIANRRLKAARRAARRASNA